MHRKNQWIAFEDETSIDIKAKYSRVRGLAGIALKDLSQDSDKCTNTILTAAYNGLSRQARAPRGAVLRSLERELLETVSRPLDNIQVSPYRISRVIDVEGHVHDIRKVSDTSNSNFDLLINTETFRIPERNLLVHVKVISFIHVHAEDFLDVLNSINLLMNLAYSNLIVPQDWFLMSVLKYAFGQVVFRIHHLVQVVVKLLQFLEKDSIVHTMQVCT